jgi:hypothetical protein
VQQPGVFDLNLYRGDSYHWQARLWEDAPGGTPTDLTGATAKSEIRDKSAGTKVVELDTAIIPPNVVDITMTPAMWLDCPATGVWDLQLTMPSGEVRTALTGKVTTTPDVTDSVPPPIRRAVAAANGRVLS